MFPKGTIYEKGKSGSHGEVVLVLSKLARFTYKLIRSFGAGLIGFAIIGLLFAYGPILKQEILFRVEGGQEMPIRSKFGDLIHFAEADRVARIQSEAENYQVDSHFSVVIPKIDAAANVIANVDASKEEEYLEALKKGVAHAKGTYFPGQGRGIYLFSHSTDSPLNIAQYNAVFYLLRKLESGDRIIVYFADKRYVYEVEEIVITSKDDTSWLTKNYDSETLVLQTCDPPGTTWRRLLVIGKRVKV